MTQNEFLSKLDALVAEFAEAQANDDDAWLDRLCDIGDLMYVYELENGVCTKDIVHKKLDAVKEMQ